MKQYENVTCPQLAFNWSIKLIESFLIPILLAFLFDDVFLKVAFIAFGVLDYIISSMLTGYGFSVMKAFVWFKIGQNGVSNAFYKIVWNEIQLESIYFEHIKIKRTLTNNHKLKFVAGDCGIVMMIQKEKSNSTFKNYSLKKTVCIPLNAHTKTALLKNCPEGSTVKNALNEFDEEYILELICEKESKTNNKKSKLAVSALEICEDRVK
ncbi:MAG: hypothetical protein IJ039_07340 [Clostridia bacterium]|nr:hypothetical protein [Clostridia bacterium]